MDLSRFWIWGIVVAVIAATVVAAVIVRRRDVRWRVWTVSITFCVSCVIGVVLIWVRVNTVPGPLVNGVPVTNAAEVASFLRQLPPASPNIEAEIHIPTGVFLQSIDFDNANNVVVTGYIWQKYGPDVPADIERGVILPEGDKMEMDEAYHVRQGDTDVLGWYFKTTLREDFFYDRYPLDRQDVWLRIWAKDFERNIVLVPDVEAYADLTPETLPGIESDFVLEYWTLENSYFSYRENRYNTDFGLTEPVRQEIYPELYFNVGIERNTLDALLTFIVPPIITALMVFGILLLVTKQAERTGLSGWHSTTVLGFCASLLFVIFFAQINMRSRLNAEGVIYIEQLYFIVYAAILLVCLDSILFTHPDRFPFVEFEDNLVAKAVYWPFVTGSFFLVTLATFA